MLRELYGYPIRYSREHKGYYYEATQTLPINGLWFNTDELQALLIIRQPLGRLQLSLLSPSQSIEGSRDKKTYKELWLSIKKAQLLSQ